MKMNIVVLTFLICFLVTTSVNAALLLPTNGDFEGDTFVGRGGNIMPVGWNNANNIIDGGWGNPTVDEDYATDGNNGYVIASVDGTNATSGGYAVVFQDPYNMSLAALGIPAGEYISFSADINDLIPGGGGPGAILKLEFYNASGTQISNIERQITVSGTGWGNYLETFLSPATTVSVKFVFGVSTGWGGPNLKPSSFGFDNLKVGSPWGPVALMPIPVVEGALDPNNAVISWSNPEEAINADVYLLGSDTNYTPSSSYPDPRYGVKIANDTTLESLAISVEPNKYYYWVVDVNTGSLEGIGFTWKFQTFDTPVSDVNAGIDQYRWLVGGTSTFTLNGSYTDDGKSPVTVRWTNTTAPGDTDPGTSVVFQDANSLTTQVTVDNTGWFEFTLTVTDAISSGSDSVHIGVYANACEAAKADPGDIQARYPNGHGDIDGDCDTDLHDFALFAGSWLDCMSPKLGCTP